MEFTYQSTMQLPASYAVLSEDEMVYTVGGAFELNINAQDVLNFTVNVGVNLVRMLGQAAIMPAFAGIFGVKAEFAQFFGGTSLLILVGVVLDTLQQVESHLLMRHYDGLLNSGRIKGRAGNVAAY